MRDHGRPTISNGEFPVTGTHLALTMGVESPCAIDPVPGPHRSLEPAVGAPHTTVSLRGASVVLAGHTSLSRGGAAGNCAPDGTRI